MSMFISTMALIAASGAFLLAIVHNNIPLAIAGAAFLILSIYEEEKHWKYQR